MDRLGSIEAFVRAAELGSFTLAARRLQISPSAFGRRISQLEESLGLRLFHRTTRAVTLTDDGRVFFEHCRDVLQELDDAQNALSGRREAPAGLLRIEAPTILGRHVVVPAVARYVEKYPDIDVNLTLRDEPSDLASEGIDVAVRLGALADSGLVVRKIGIARMRTCGSPRYLKTYGTPKSVDDLMDHTCIGFSHGGRLLPWRLREKTRSQDMTAPRRVVPRAAKPSRADHAAKPGGRVTRDRRRPRGAAELGVVREFRPRARIVVNTAEALVDLAVAGRGLAWACDFMVAHALSRGDLEEVLADAACEEEPIHMVMLPARTVLPKVRRFVEEVVTELGKAHAAR